MIDLGAHALDSGWCLMGTPRPISVSAQVYRNFEHLLQNPLWDERNDPSKTADDV